MTTIIVLTTTKNEKEAEKIAEKLVEERIAACTNILEGVKSIYRWKGEIEREEEHLLLVKTLEENFDKAKRKIRDLHSYETPEIISIRVQDGLPEYLEWIEKNSE